MTTLTKGKTPGDWLMFEEGAQYSRDTRTIGSGADLGSGTVLGEVTASKKLVACNPGASDGSEVAKAVLLNPAQAETADVVGVVIARHATVRRLGLTFGAGFANQAQRDTAMEQLLAVGIKSN
jgi:hypothetical protein